MAYTHRKNTASKYQKTADLTKDLQQAVKELRQTDDYKKLLNLMASLHHYSLNNLLLIAWQRPNASMVMGYKAWNKYGRHVKAGEHGIRIYAPMRYTAAEKTTDDKDDTDDSTEEKKKKSYVRFRAVSVFDVGQTDGDPLPDLGGSTESFSGNFSDYQEMIAKIKTLNPDTGIKFIDRKNDANGWFDSEINEIAVCSDMSETETIRTLIHEEAHSRLHRRGGEEADTGRNVKECEAEGISYVVCRMLGIDTASYAIPYITEWMHEATDQEMKDAMSVIQQTAAEFANVLQLEK